MAKYYYTSASIQPREGPGRRFEGRVTLRAQKDNPSPFMSFDTHRLIRKLREFGLEERHAEGIAEVLKNLESGRGSAPHRDVELMRQEVRDLEFRIDAKFQAIQRELMAVKLLLGLVSAGIVALVAKAWF
jgi:hypothetical protein